MTNTEKLKEELKELKTQYHDILKKLEKKKKEIAFYECPLEIGDIVKVKCSDKEFKGKITHVNYFYANLVDHVLNNVNSSPTWCIQGKRVNKTSGEVGKWSFSANPIFFDYNNILKTFTQREDWIEAMFDNE